MIWKQGGRSWCELVEKDQYVVTHQIDWEVGKKGSRLFIHVPVGFTFESSVPRWLWWLISPHDEHYLLAAAIHDWLLENDYRPAFAAGEWYDAAKAMHSPDIKRLLMYLTVSVWTILT